MICLKIQRTVIALQRSDQSQFKYAAILLVLMILEAWPALFCLSCPISFHCWVSPSNCKILSRVLLSKPPAHCWFGYYHLPAHCCYQLSPEIRILLLMLAPASLDRGEGSLAAQAHSSPWSVSTQSSPSGAVSTSVLSVGSVQKLPSHTTVHPPVTRYT